MESSLPGRHILPDPVPDRFTEVEVEARGDDALTTIAVTEDNLNALQPDLA